MNILHFKRLKNIENAQKNLIIYNDNESIYYTPRSEFDDKDEKQQTNNINKKPLNVFDYLKSLSQKADELMDEIKEGDDDVTVIIFYLLVVIEELSTLTLLICH